MGGGSRGNAAQFEPAYRHQRPTPATAPTTTSPPQNLPTPPTVALFGRHHPHLPPPLLPHAVYVGPPWPSAW